MPKQTPQHYIKYKKGGKKGGRPWKAGLDKEKIIKRKYCLEKAR
jgi:hypothetical protein